MHADADGEAPAYLDVTYLANEGFLLRAGDDALLVDAFVAEPYSVYAGLCDEARAKLEAGAAPFDAVDLALTSHVHRDHFQPATACAFLAAAPDCVFVSTHDAVSWLTCDGLDRGRVRAVTPEPGESETLTVGDVRVEVLRLSHGSGRFESVQNLGHVVAIGGLTVLHVGDAEPRAENFAPYRLAERGIDVAFLPYWYFGGDAGRRIVREQVAARHVVAVHVPPVEVEDLAAALARTDPDVAVFRECLETRRFPGPAEAAEPAAADDGAR